MTIPIPDNPQHVQNLASISLLEAQGFEGNDASLSESLFCYGMAWRDLGEEWLIIYGIKTDPSGSWTMFDRCTMRKDTDARHEWNWVNWDSFIRFLSDDPDALEQWHTLPLPMRASDLVSYYGTEEIFGSCYWEGFAISED